MVFVISLAAYCLLLLKRGINQNLQIYLGDRGDYRVGDYFSRRGTALLGIIVFLIQNNNHDLPEKDLFGLNIALSYDNENI